MKSQVVLMEMGLIPKASIASACADAGFIEKDRASLNVQMAHKRNTGAAAIKRAAKKRKSARRVRK